MRTSGRRRPNQLYRQKLRPPRLHLISKLAAIVVQHLGRHSPPTAERRPRHPTLLELTHQPLGFLAAPSTTYYCRTRFTHASSSTRSEDPRKGGLARTDTTYSVPVARRVPKIEQIKVTGVFKPEPTLAGEDYEEILRIMKSMVQVMELSPHAFSDMGEEDLRWHFLVQLNRAYKGQATGETFNFQGKTDILIRVASKNVFIAECKFWKGEKSLSDTIDQLLSYLSWRDTKTAILVFNRNADFSAVLAKIVEAVPKHPKFKRDLGKQDESTFRYVFVQPNDAT